MKEKPKIQVLIFEPKLTHSTWCDYYTRCRTMAGIERELRSQIKSGRIVGYRFITIHEEVLGLIKSRHQPLCQKKVCVI